MEKNLEDLFNIREALASNKPVIDQVEESALKKALKNPPNFSVFNSKERLPFAPGTKIALGAVAAITAVMAFNYVAKAAERKQKNGENSSWVDTVTKVAATGLGVGGVAVALHSGMKYAQSAVNDFTKSANKSTAR
jgi:hypothetical protein